MEVRLDRRQIFGIFITISPQLEKVLFSKPTPYSGMCILDKSLQIIICSFFFRSFTLYRPFGLRKSFRCSPNLGFSLTTTSNGSPVRLSQSMTNCPLKIPVDVLRIYWSVKNFTKKNICVGHVTKNFKSRSFGHVNM